MCDGYLPRLRWSRHPLGYLGASLGGFPGSGLPLWCREQRRGRSVVSDGAGWWRRDVPFTGCPYSGSVQRRGAPAHGGQWGTQSPQSWEVNISYVCSACLMLPNSRATLWSCIGCFHNFSTRKPAALHWQRSLAFKTKLSHCVVP